MRHFLGLVVFKLIHDKFIVRHLYRDIEFRLDIIHDNARVDMSAEIFFDELFDLDYGETNRIDTYESL